MTIISILGVLGLLVSLLALIFVLATPRGKAHITLLQRVIRALYRTAAWIEDLAIATDRGYLSYRLERSINEIEPENEKFGTVAVLPEAAR
jgi:hypothetical protein